MSTEAPKKRGFLSRLFGERAATKPEAGEPTTPPAAALPEATASASSTATESATEPLPAVVAEMPADKRGWFQKLRQGLGKTSSKLTDGIVGVFT